eukprot:scaffold215_cov389-Pavlova_lutheri.AAC.5
MIGFRRWKIRPAKSCSLLRGVFIHVVFLGLSKPFADALQIILQVGCERSTLYDVGVFCWYTGSYVPDGCE